MSATPFLGHQELSAIVAWRGREALRVADFLHDVAVVADALPARRYLVNLCSDRYRFAVGLAAALSRDQVSLLPPTHTPELLRTLKQGYAGLYALSDGAQSADVVETFVFPATAAAPGAPLELSFPDSQLAAIAFTSGSTGQPAPHPKSWGRLAFGAVGEARALGLTGVADAVLVATVPPQHMYGLESSVLLALRGGLALHAGRPFYPADIRAALEAVAGERVLVTTPVHLRALLAEEGRLPPLRLILSATAPLSAALAAESEARYGAPLHEIYGFTEAGMVASRRTTQGPQWHALPGVRLWRETGGVKAGGGHVQTDAVFTDVVELEDAYTFVLHGRSADLVNIAGKRTSLAYLDQQLASIEGVEDGVFFMPDEAAAGITRLTAFVVAPRLSREALLSALRQRIDPAFLPRPLYLVPSLPRNATGKLPRDALVRLAAARAGSGRAS
jgi:acyl-coenzyme A synthetase/AMP-(fatty) acid ligase